MRDVNSRVRYLFRDLTRGCAFSFTRNARNSPLAPTFFAACKDAVVVWDYGFSRVTSRICESPRPNRTIHAVRIARLLRRLRLRRHKKRDAGNAPVLFNPGAVSLHRVEKYRVTLARWLIGGPAGVVHRVF